MKTVNGLAIELGADLSGANLSGADLSGANLRSVNLRSANLRRANLRSADLSGANLSGANLRSADLYDADLRSADLYDADLSGANLRSADLSGANLRSADLSGANLRDADLRGADLRGAKNIPPLVAGQLSIVADGELTVYKRCREGIVTLRVPGNAKRSNATGRKCRAEFAVVIETPGHAPAHSTHDPSFIYVEGATVRPTNGFDDDRWNECGAGIHFFLTRIEAEEYR